ncbi:hypothetical protein Agabi119p4_11359 [Agaricus bisporus var. burnettii]|uniref:Cytochrome P450 monooxygenase pc-3 n=1 Tax=Agaricus bisporus var. burnettii TaxID=192524 RepID=A0A8H7C139_AGABI|nr:hypothetical protein Agabi119p4_11359 [Agaricus bisporus var. burnettii]
MTLARTPGIDFLATGFVFLSIPVFGFIALGKAHEYTGGRALPTWVLVSAGIASIPVYAVSRVVTTRLRHKREAAAMGAKMVPVVRGKWLGNADVVKVMIHNATHGYPADGLAELFGELGPVINIRSFWSDLVFTTTPEHVKIMLCTDFENYVKGEEFQRNMDSVLGVGVFNSDGDMWKFHRSITRPAFARDRISDFQMFDRHAETVIQQLKSRFGEGQAVDFQDLMSRFSLDSATEFLFGHCVHSLRAGLPYSVNTPYAPKNIQTPETRRANEFSTAFLEAFEGVAHRERLRTVWPLFEIFSDRTKKPMEVLDDFLEPIIADAIQKKSAVHHEVEAKPIETSEGTLLDHLVQVTSDPKILKDETLNIMLAGRDTTTGTLTFAVYLLSQYPHVMQRLRQEVLEKVGPTKCPTFDNIREMKYLRAVLNETLRLYPVVPFNVRESVNGTTWPNPDPNGKPFYIPAGTRTLYSVFMMQRREDLWGPDAEEFDPDRFLDERVKKYLVKNSFIFLPFNAGPRICLGQQFAYNEMSFILIRLLQNFSSISLELDAYPPGTLPPDEFKLASGRKAIDKVWPKANLTLYLAGGLWLKMEES